jgi:hypothetical protein
MASPNPGSAAAFVIDCSYTEGSADDEGMPGFDLSQRRPAT